ncbi:unnamed protein product [Calypogeia fissa]
MAHAFVERYVLRADTSRSSSSVATRENCLVRPKLRLVQQTRIGVFGFTQTDGFNRVWGMEFGTLHIAPCSAFGRSSTMSLRHIRAPNYCSSRTRSSAGDKPWRVWTYIKQAHSCLSIGIPEISCLKLLMRHSRLLYVGRQRHHATSGESEIS